ncbi:MAG: hypothetical protein C0597_09480 [Marinilabiliales bacterium]|nr:MAG: hypothetical protein C0597_09480 [Marinilabiliales bacterium]
MIQRHLILAALLFLTACLKLFSQDTEVFDTLVYFNEITYHSELEEEAFNEYFSEDNSSFIKLFLAKDENITKQQYEIRLTSFLDYTKELREDKNYNKPEKKKVKYYYNLIHNKYLEKYEMNTNFSKIFNNGYYNCVTGSILYGLIFDELKIPYKIKLSPIHAYLITYPQTESILVETTNPVKGYFIFNENFKQNYVDHLLDNKLITASEYASYSTEELFNKYYFKEEDVTLKEMVGIQYYNEAVIQFQNQKFEEAFYELEKAYLFYPSEKIAYLLYYSAALVIDKHDFSDIKYVDFLYKIARYTNYGITQEQIIGEFGRITQNQLDYKGNYELYDAIFFKLYEKLNDEEIKNEISFIYNYEKARLFIRNERYESAFPYIEKALQIRPDHLDLQTMFIYALANKMESLVLTNEKLESLVDYAEKYPALKNNNTYNDMVCDAYLYTTIQNYEEGNLSEALLYHAKLKELIKKHEHYSNYDYNITRLYSSAAVYYFRKGNTKKAKTILLEGLKFVPDSYELKQRLKVIN